MEKGIFIDLFAGAGGLSEGFINSGFTPVAQIESDADASNTLRTRMAYHYLEKKNSLKLYRDYLLGNINKYELRSEIPNGILDTVLNIEIKNENLTYIFNRINENVDASGSKNVDVVIGGPPCQAYSVVGRARDRNGMQDDPRNYLYKMYVEFLKHFQPRLFVFENVTGLLSAMKGEIFRDVKENFKNAGYEIDYKILNARDFGVLQNRKRIILIGWKKGMKICYPEFVPKNGEYLVRDIFQDLPKIEPGILDGQSSYTAPPTKYLKSYKIRKNDDILTHHVTRTNNENDKEIYRRAIILWKSEKKRLHYNDLPPENRTHKNMESFLDRFKVVADDLPYSQTVVSHIAKDGHYYIYPDTSQLRSLSVRESARLQSFQDSYYFEGPRTSAFNQIGNAVPPLMANGIADAVKDMLGGL